MVRKLIVTSLALAAAGAFLVWLFLPPGFAVKGPVLDFLIGRQIGAPGAATIESRFELPAGYRLGLFAEGLKAPRMMEITTVGDLVVSETRAGGVVVLHADQDGDGRADGRTQLLDNKVWPHGLALYGAWLFVAEEHQVTRYRYDAAARQLSDPDVVLTGLPEGGNHRTRTLKAGPDGWLYLTTGSSCNVCEEDHPYRSTMLRFQPDGSGTEVIATGLRNSVGFDWDPATLMLYATENGRDLLGDDIPDDELNLVEAGGFYGWPYAYGARVPDPDRGEGHAAEIRASRPMLHGFGAHRAPLGIDFISNPLAPRDLRGDALVALHGSWNRSTLAGYKVVALSITANGSVSQRDFLTGFLGRDEGGDESVIGRPVDIEEGPDGAIYISDDYAGVIWRVGYGDLAVAGSVPVAPQGQVDPLAALTPDERARLESIGALIFATRGCSTCHVANPAAPDVAVKPLEGLGARYDIEGLEALLSSPPSPMPSYDFTDFDRRALAVYLLGL